MQSRRNDGVRVPVMDAAVPVRSKSSKAEGGRGGEERGGLERGWEGGCDEGRSPDVVFINLN